MLQKQVGIEIEFFVKSKKKFVLPGSSIPRDDFPLVGEIRALPGTNVGEVMANVTKQTIAIKKSLRTREMVFSDTERIPLKLYQQATRECEVRKNELVGQARNIYGTDISDYSDQIIKDGKIQGINASCGLHIHFSCRQLEEYTYKKDVYKYIDIPLKTSSPGDEKELLSTSLSLFKHAGYKEHKTLSVSASLLNKPTVEWMVKKLDEKFFARFMEGKTKTKYRQPGFFELKSYGFEYRSLPASQEVIDNLQEIVEYAFELLNEAKQWS